MASIARPRNESVRLLMLAVVALSSASACVPSRDLHEYSALNGGGAADGGPGGGAPASNGGAGGSGAPTVPGAPAPDAGGVDPNETGDAGGAGERADSGAETPPADAATGPCAAQELLGPNRHCYFLDANALGWDAARSACQARGAGWDLASVRSPADSAFLGAALAFEAWLGASDSASEGTWVWVVDNRPFWFGTGANGFAPGGAYVNWNATEPNGANTTNCARALPRSFGSPNPDAPWADLACGTPLGAICEAYAAP